MAAREFALHETRVVRVPNNVKYGVVPAFEHPEEGLASFVRFVTREGMVVQPVLGDFESGVNTKEVPRIGVRNGAFAVGADEGQAFPDHFRDLRDRCSTVEIRNSTKEIPV